MWHERPARASAAFAAKAAKARPGRSCHEKYMEESKRNYTKLILGIVLLAIVARLGVMVGMKRWNSPNAIEHRQLAASLVDSGTFSFREAMFDDYGPSSVQSPPYPFILATCFKIFGKETHASYAAAMVLNAIVAGVGVWLLYRLVLEWGGNEITAVLAALMLAIWPSQVYAATQVQAISIIITAVIAILYFFAISVRTGDVTPWIAYSLVGTLAALTEPVLLPILALSGLMIFVWRGNLTLSQRTRNAAILFAAAVLIIFPWTYRNRIVHGQWIPIKSTFWVNVWKGNNPFATGTDRVALTEERLAQLGMKNLEINTDRFTNPQYDSQHQYDMLTGGQRNELLGKSEAEREEVFKKYAKTWIKENPGRYFQLCVKRLWMSGWADLDNPKARNPIYLVCRALLMPTTVIGLLLAWRKRWKFIFPLLLWGSCLMTYTLTVTANRFTLPFEPLQFALLALLVTPVIQKFIGREPHGVDVSPQTLQSSRV